MLSFYYLLKRQRETHREKEAAASKLPYMWRRPGLNPGLNPGCMKAEQSTTQVSYFSRLLLIS